MKMYKETLRKLIPIGVPLALITIIYTVITSGQNYFGTYVISASQAAIRLAPVLVYYTLSGILFAYYGFSYLFRRAASDLYHSLPISRFDLYLSTTLATATWMGGTIVLNLLAVLGLLLISGCPFVPVYIPMAMLFFFVASMLVYAAAAVGCALSGTLLTALASTGIVLFVPRFIQFIVARGVVARVPIVGWLDLPALLNPASNIATGMVVMQSRQVFVSRIINMPNTLYSMLPMLVLLLLGAWLFIRRSSETAEKGTGRKVWIIATASLLALAALLLITVDNHRLLSMYGVALVAIAFLVFVVYQFIASRNIKQILFSTPWFLLTCAVAFALSLGIDATVENILGKTPAPTEIASVQFRGHDEKMDNLEYTTVLLQEIDYTADSMKKYVSETLADAVDRIKEKDFYAFDVYSQYQTIEPIAITLTSGETIKRTIEFKNVMELNALREEDPFFQAAIRAFPTLDSIQYINSDILLTKEESLALLTSFISESQKNGLVPNSYYRPRSQYLDDRGYALEVNGDQTVGRISIAGYVADKRIYEYYTLRMETPETAALMMRTYNAYIKEGMFDRLAQALKHMASPLAIERESLSVNLDFYNLTNQRGDRYTQSVNLYISGYTKHDEAYADIYLTYLEKFVEIIKRGTPTDNTDRMFVRFDWFEYDGTSHRHEQEPACYLAFSQEDELALQALIIEWQTATMV